MAEDIILTDKYIAEWLEKNFFSRNKNSMRKSPIWKTIRDQLGLLGNWKNAGRGVPFDGTESFAFKKRS